MRNLYRCFVIGMIAASFPLCVKEAWSQTQKRDSTAVTFAVAEANPLDPTVVKELVGVWKNQLGSKLIIKAIDGDTGAVSGTYQTKPKAGTQGEEFPLVGWVNTSPPEPGLNDHVVVVSFSVRWGKIGSVTTWNGSYDSPKGAKPAIVGQWLLTRPNSNFEWDHVLTGQDTFHREPPEPKE